MSILKGKNLLPILALLFSLVGTTSHGATPLDSLLQGQTYEDDGPADPLQYVFQKNHDKKEEGHLLPGLNQYIGFHYEGENLKNYCKVATPILYSTAWHADQAKRAVVATLQLFGLDLSVLAVAKYAQKLSFTKEEFTHLTDRLMGQYCSSNISVISLRSLRQNLLAKFEHNDFDLPSMKDNSYFPRPLLPWTESSESLENGLLYSVKLFRAFCSWGGDVSHYRLLAPILRQPAIMSYLSRQMAQKKIEWKYDPSGRASYVLVPDPLALRVSCNNLICRRSGAADFFKNFPLAIGSNGIDQDVQRLYCQHFSVADAGEHRQQEKHVKKWLDQQSFDEENLMVAHFYSLITGVPDFFLGAKKFKEAITFMRAPIDQTWLSWAVWANKNYSSDLFYEESLSVERVPREYYFARDRARFRVIFDVNMGEIDRSQFMADKIALSFKLKIPGSVLSYARRSWVHSDPRRPEAKAAIKTLLKAQVELSVEKARKLFVVPPWEGDLADIISEELLEQFKQYHGDFFDHLGHDKVEIPIEFRYAPFALKYLHYRFRAARGLPEIDI